MQPWKHRLERLRRLEPPQPRRHPPRLPRPRPYSRHTADSRASNSNPGSRDQPFEGVRRGDGLMLNTSPERCTTAAFDSQDYGFTRGLRSQPAPQ